MSRGRIAMWVASAGLLFAVPATGHHSFAAEFDIHRPLKLRGVVKRMDWINPHCWIHIDVKGGNGQMVRWMIEAGSPNTLIRRGLTKASVPIGAEVIVDGYRAKDESNKANGKEITLLDGRKFLLGANTPDATIR